MSGVDHFHYRVEWSGKHKQYAGIVTEFPTLVAFAADQASALAGIKAKVTAHLSTTDVAAVSDGES